MQAPLPRSPVPVCIWGQQNGHILTQGGTHALLLLPHACWTSLCKAAATSGLGIFGDLCSALGFALPRQSCTSWAAATASSGGGAPLQPSHCLVALRTDTSRVSFVPLGLVSFSYPVGQRAQSHNRCWTMFFQKIEVLPHSESSKYPISHMGTRTPQVLLNVNVTHNALNIIFRLLALSTP